jgi:outer membrane protein
MYSNYLFRIVIIAFMAATPVLAQAQGELKIGVVNVGRLLQESPQAVSAGARLEDEFAPRQREIMALQTELEEKAARIQKDLEVMGEEERDNAQRDLRNDEREIGRAQNEFREDLDLRRNEVIGAVQRDVLLAVKIYGDAEGYDMILAEGIVQFNPRIEVTDQVLERLRSDSESPAVAE